MAVRFKFYDLDVWQKSITFANDIYTLTSRYPDAEKFGLTNQLRRASVSVSSNIAEGSSRTSSKEYSRFVEIAYGSVMEVVSQLCISFKLSYIQRTDFDKLTLAADELAKMLSGLRKSITK